MFTTNRSRMRGLAVMTGIACASLLAGCAEGSSPPVTQTDLPPTVTETVYETESTATETLSQCTSEDLTLELSTPEKASASFHFINTSDHLCVIDPGHVNVHPIDADGNQVAINFEQSKQADRGFKHFELAPSDSVWAVYSFSESSGTGAEIPGAVALEIELPGDTASFTIPLDGPMFYSNGDMKVSGHVGPLTAEQQLG